MSSNNVITEEFAVEEQALEADANETAADERRELRPCVEQEIQAKVDGNHPEGIRAEYSHLTLVEEERIQGGEAELERISERAKLGHQDGRAQRTQDVVCEQQRRRRARVEERDPRRALSRTELARVNQEADRLVDELEGISRAAISRMLARRVSDGQSLTEAVFATLDAWKAEPGVPCAIDEVGEVPGDEVTIEGTVIELWESSTSNVQQVGLIADDTGSTKFTVWRKSDCTTVAEGETVRLRAAKVNWYQGRWSVALTYDSRIVFPERDNLWWDA